LEYTPDQILKLEPNYIVVVGTNTEGRSGKGFAKECIDRFGLKQGHKRGLCGQCYAIITKDLALGLRSIPLSHIKKQLILMYNFARNIHPDKKFLLTKIGTNLAGYTEKELKQLLDEIEDLRPVNVILPRFN